MPTVSGIFSSSISLSDGDGDGWVTRVQMIGRRAERVEGVICGIDMSFGEDYR